MRRSDTHKARLEVLSALLPASYAFGFAEPKWSHTPSGKCCDLIEVVWVQRRFQAHQCGAEGDAVSEAGVNQFREDL